MTDQRIIANSEQNAYRVIIGKDYVTGDFTITSADDLRSLIKALDAAGHCLFDPRSPEEDERRLLRLLSPKGDLR